MQEHEPTYISHLFRRADGSWAIQSNEVGAVSAGTPIFVEASRQQRNTLMLRDVRYRLYARLVYIPVSQRPKGHAFDKHRPGDDESPKKYNEMFLRRASQGQCFTQPYFGTRECAAYYRLVTDVEKE